MANPKLNATKRTLKRLRDLGYHTDVSEKRVYIRPGNPTHGGFEGGFTRDLFGFMDVLAYWDTSRTDLKRPNASLVGSWAIQSTSRARMSDHLKKYRRSPTVAQKIRDWIAAGNRFSIVGWEHVMVPKINGNGFKGVWRIHEDQITSDMLEPNAADLVAITADEKEAARVNEEKAKRRAAVAGKKDLPF